jgi:NADPH-dependent 2,4-dienoyl-CoA reductase/sulfur reductase-like enzyme/peroxiredoxin family protein/TusA-related sulfurtransferase/rhodanese-related sulfurtransferase
MARKTVIIGGVAGGATTAARLRRRDAHRQIIVLERGEYISYANCGLPYYIGDVIQNRGALLLQTPEAMKTKFNIEVRTSNEVTRIKHEEKKVEIKNVKTGEVYEETYDDLVISTGSSPVKPPIPGIDADNIYTLWTVPDTDEIKKFVVEKEPKRAAVIGAGFIGIEMAENLHEAGIDVSIIEMQNQVLAPVDIEMANIVHGNIITNGVNLILNDGVKAFETVDGLTTIELQSGNKVQADLVILSIGVRPNSELAKEAGIELNSRGGVVVDDHFRTSAKDVYAVGDVIEIENSVTKEKGMIPLAGPANRQAHLLADILAGDERVYTGAMGTCIAKAFDYDIGATGLNEKQLKAMGKEKNKDYFVATILQKSHAGYYPGATQIFLKVIFDKEGKIFGGQVVGQETVDKHTDVIATVMKLNGTVYDLQELELAYAPPFSSAKSATNMLGYTAVNVLEGLMGFTDIADVDAAINDPEIAKNTIILDVREDVERAVYYIPTSYHIPMGQIGDRMDELDKEKEILVGCAVGIRAHNVARRLMENGFKKVRVITGGATLYKLNHYEVKKENDAYTTPQISEGPEGEFCTTDEETGILNCEGLQCPGPIMKVNEEMEKMKENDVLQVSATDMGFASDVEAWCRRTGNTFIKAERRNRVNYVFLRKGSTEVKSVENETKGNVELPQGKTMVVFSGDLDKVLASFIIANGALAMGRQVTMFFTFWGLNALRKSNHPKVKKTFIENMFGKMMPKGSKKLKLSKMNMGGMGTAMMKKVMKDKNVDSLEELMQKAMDNGLKIVACTMSMDIMGITEEELIDGIEYAGVASYLGDAEEGNVNLFI